MHMNFSINNFSTSVKIFFLLPVLCSFAMSLQLWNRSAIKASVSGCFTLAQANLAGPPDATSAGVSSTPAGKCIDLKRVNVFFKWATDSETCLKTDPPYHCLMSHPGFAKTP